MKSSYRSGVAAIFVGGMLASTSAFAQAADDAEASGGEIIVTAQKRSENIQDVPAAITAISGAALQDRAVARLDDLQTVSPSLSVATSGVTQSVNIRGVGLASGNASASNGVATYIDGMFQPAVVTTNSFFDIASVEVFRGPQGTFVGSNSTGGALFINSRNPEFDAVSGYGQFTIGNYGRTGAEGAINLPISSTLAFRAAGYYANRNSFFKNSPGLKSRPGSLDEVAGRFGLHWKPSDNFSILAKVELNSKDTGGYAWQPLALSAYSAGINANPYQLSFDDETRNDERSFQATLKIDYVTEGGVTLRSLSGFTRKRVYNTDDLDATSLAGRPRLRRDWDINEREKTQEINIISPDSQGFKWVIGGYYQQNVIDVYIDDYTNTAEFLNILLRPTKTTKGLFGQVTVPLSDTITVDVGARHSWYKVDAYGYVKVVPLGGLTVADTGGRERDKRLTGKIAINWQPNADNTIYAFVARGYKAGGYQTPARTFKPETVIDYEIGWKASFLDRQVKTQIGAFYYDYSDFQLDAIDRGIGLNAVFNIGKATVKGFEGQIQVNHNGLLFDGGFAFVDSSLNPNTQLIDIRSYTGGSNLPQCTAPGVPAGCTDYTPFLINTTSGPNLFSPKWSWNASLGYRVETGNAVITPRINYAYLGPQFTYIAYNPVRDRIAGRGLLSASVNVELGKFELQFYGTNLTDKTYAIGQTARAQFYGAPREFGMRAKVSF